MSNGKKSCVFQGVATALITPFKNGKIDFDSFSKFIDWQIESGVDALVVCGTTGEGSTLSDEEHRECIKFVVDKTNGRVPVIAGTGSNDGAYAIDLSKGACELGADALLVVTPYYNKATQDGLVELFTKISLNSTLPIILYNVPSRTALNIEPATYKKLCDLDNIVGIKEANGNIASVAETLSLVGDSLDIYSGNDDSITAIMSLGGKGVISVLSNVIPKETCEIAHAALKGDFKTSANLQVKYFDICKALFSEVNPIPVKAACAKMGFCENSLRLPLTPMSKDKEKVLFDVMKKHGVI